MHIRDLFGRSLKITFQKSDYFIESCSWESEESRKRNYKAAASRIEDIENNIIIKENMSSLSLIPLKKADILDVGCGRGDYALYLKGKQWDYTGIDCSQKLIELAKDIHKDSRFEVSGFDKLIFKDKSFDIVFASGTIQYVKNWKFCLGESARILKENGYLVLTRLPILKYNNTSSFLQTVKFKRNIEIHPFWVFNRNDFEIAIKEYFDIIQRDYGPEQWDLHLNEPGISNSYILKNRGN
jgi:ubiquinone/menaquinone biosynthesis C-methylase UbiE